MYQTSQFRFPMGRAGHHVLDDLANAVSDYLRWAPNQGGDETPRENIRSAFLIVRSRLNRGASIQSAVSDLWSIADSFRDM